MDLARVSRRADWAFAGLVILLHMGLFLWPERSRQPDLLIAAAHDAQLFASIVLILTWALLGPGRWWVRVGTLPILLALWFLPWNTRMLPRETAASFPLAVTIAAALMVAALLASKLRIAKSPQTGRETGAQFSILSLLVATTLIAAAIGVLQWLHPTLSTADNSEFLLPSPVRTSAREGLWITPQTVRQLVMAAAVAAAGVGGVWVVLRPGGMWLRGAALAVSLAMLGVYLPQLSGVPSQRLTEVAVNLTLALASISALTALTVLPLRLLNFRLQRPMAAATSANAAAPALDRPRLIRRMAALAGLILLLLGGIPLARYLHRSHGQSLESPTQSFAHWVDLRQRPTVIIRGLPYRAYFVRPPQFDTIVDERTFDLTIPTETIEANQPESLLPGE